MHGFSGLFRLTSLAAVACVPALSVAQTPQPVQEMTPEVILEGITVREGYEVTMAVEFLQGIRFLEFGDRGELYASIPSRGEIVTLEDEDGDGMYESATTFLRNQTSRGLHGMHFRDGWLWYTTSTSIWKARDTDGDGVSDENENILEDLPGGTGHWWRPIFVTDTHLYTGVGDRGNVENETETDRQKLFKYNLDGTGKTLFSSGVRNTEKLRYRPGTTELWGVDHGSDNFGRELGETYPTEIPITDYFPPDELNLYVEGGFYGHPFLVGNRVPRVEYQEHPDILKLAAETIVPEWGFPAHAAANAFTFIEESDAFPDDHTGDMFVAQRGSWNRSSPAGYSVVRVLFDNGKPYGMLTIIDALAKDRLAAFMRPIDCAQAPDGSVIVSYDHNVPHAPPGAVRIRWVGDEKNVDIDEPEDENGGE